MDLLKLTKRILVAHRESPMAEPKQIMEEETVPEGMLVLENASLHVELEE